MELDKTTIVLRQRSIPDLIDLSLVVLRVYWKPLLTYAAFGVIPCMLLNFIVLRRLSDYDAMLAVDVYAIEEFPLRVRYLAYLSSIVFFEVPIAMLGVTYYLGHTLFRQPTSFRDLRNSIVGMLPGLVLVLGILRLGALAWLAVLCLPIQADFDPFLEVFLLGTVLLGGAMLVRAMRPFAPEILMLEKSPIRNGGKLNPNQPLAFGQRAHSLHGQLSGDLLIRSAMLYTVTVMILCAVTLGELFLTGVFFGVWTWEWWMDSILFPINLWVIALWSTVFRFLSYLDCRTRLEGWELDLRMRAEAKRLTGAIE